MTGIYLKVYLCCFIENQRSEWWTEINLLTFCCRWHCLARSDLRCVFYVRPIYKPFENIWNFYDRPFRLSYVEKLVAVCLSAADKRWTFWVSFLQLRVSSKFYLRLSISSLAYIRKDFKSLSGCGHEPSETTFDLHYLRGETWRSRF